MGHQHQRHVEDPVGARVDREKWLYRCTDLQREAGSMSAKQEVNAVLDRS